MTRIRGRIVATGERILTMAKRVIDQFDMEAEREGNAIKGHTVIRRGWGKGITKQRNMHKRGGEILTNRVVNRLKVFK